MTKAKLNQDRANRLIRIIRDDLGQKQQIERNNLREESTKNNMQGQGPFISQFENQLKEISLAFLNAYITSIEKNKYICDDIKKIITQHIQSFIKNQSEAFYYTIEEDLVRKGATKGAVESTKNGIHLIANRTIAYCKDVLHEKIESINESLNTQKPTVTQMNNLNEVKTDYWDNIKKDFDVSKRILCKKINFIKDSFNRQVIFRDIEQAYILCKRGFYKPSVLLAGGVIEELLRQYLNFKNIAPQNDTFDGYIKACEQHGLLKSAIRQLSDSVRQFRNLVHIAKEQSPKYSISRATAWGAVSIIFTISNDF
jgi:hypothetical protein